MIEKFNRKVDFYYFKGKASWAKVHTPDTAFEPQWNIRVHLDPDSLSLFKKLKEKDGEVEGIMNDIKMDDDGEYVVFRRYVTRKWKGIETQLTPPIVVDKNNRPTTENIGNGSDVTVKVQCYTFAARFNRKLGRAIRLESVRVDHLVPFERSDLTENEEKQVAGMDAIPITPIYDPGF